MNWDDYFLILAQDVLKKSKDENTKIGAIIVGQNNQTISTGYNSFPRGINDDVPERQSRENGEKYYWFSHAETNAIINCALNGVSSNGAKMYMSCGIPCADCARNIINAGIKEIWCKKDDYTQKKWEESAKRSLVMFEEAKIKVNYYEDKGTDTEENS